MDSIRPIVMYRKVRERMDRLFLRISEAAEVAGIGRSKAYELVANGEWPSVHIGRSVRVPAEGLREWARRKVEESRVDSFGMLGK